MNRTVRSRRTSIAVCLATLLLAVAAPGVGRAGDAQDHDRARQALQAGEILPLRTILERVERDHPGQVIDVELERDDGRWVYEIKLLRAGGALVKLDIDARDGSLIARKERRRDDAQPRPADKR
jgi:uncharacterized membrane protein YkoI